VEDDPVERLAELRDAWFTGVGGQGVAEAVELADDAGRPGLGRDAGGEQGVPGSGVGAGCAGEVDAAVAPVGGRAAIAVSNPVAACS
jgi:hypothetical protein